MTDQKKNEQRRIGQQIMLVRIIKAENTKTARTGFSYVDMDNLVIWSGFTKDEVRDIRDCCHYLSEYDISGKLIFQYEKESNKTNEGKSGESFLKFINFSYGYLSGVLRAGLKAPAEIWEEFIRETELCKVESVKELFYKHFPKEAYFENPEEIERMFTYFKSYVTGRIWEVMNSYNEDVVKEMLDEELRGYLLYV